MAKPKSPTMAEPMAPAELSTETGGPPSPEQEMRMKADIAALQIVAKAAPAPSLELYLWLKRKFFHEKGMDDVWLTIAKGIGADKPPPEWIDEDNVSLPPAPQPIESHWNWLADLLASPTDGQAGYEYPDITTNGAPLHFAFVDSVGQNCTANFAALAVGDTLAFLDAGTRAPVMAFAVTALIAPSDHYAVRCDYVSGTEPPDGTALLLVLPAASA